MVTASDVLQAFGQPSQQAQQNEDVLSLNTRLGATGPLTADLCSIFNFENRRAIREIVFNGGNATETRGRSFQLENALQVSVSALIGEFHTKAPSLSEGVREVLGICRGEYQDSENENQPRKKRYFNLVLTKPVLSDYTRRIAQWLRLLLQLLDENTRVICNIVFDRPSLQAIQTFSDSMRTADDIRELVMKLLSHRRGIRSKYNSEPFCLLPVAHFISATYNFSCSASANKTICALKYLCRGCTLVALSDLSEDVVDDLKELDLVRSLSCSPGLLRPFATMHRLHTGVCAIRTPILSRLRLVDEGSVYVDNVKFTTDLLSSVIRRCFRKSTLKLRRLLMGYTPEEISTPAVVEYGEDVYSAFGQPSDGPNGSQVFLNYILADNSRRKQFFTATQPIRTKIGASKRFLRLCIEFEKYALPLMHLLMAGTSRGTDYEQLTYRNGGVDLPRRITILNEELLFVDRQSRKTALLNGEHDSEPAVVSRKWFEHIVHYWLIIRPFCVLLARGLRKSEEEIERWQRYCFVKATGRQVAKVVKDGLRPIGEGATLQRLRHASEHFFRQDILPQEHDLQRHYDYDRLFGHSYLTGLSYAARHFGGSDKRHAGIDISSIVRCCKAFWQLLQLGEPAHVAESEEEDSDEEDSEEEDSDEEDSEDEDISAPEVAEEPVDTSESEEDDSEEEDSGEVDSENEDTSAPGVAVDDQDEQSVPSNYESDLEDEQHEHSSSHSQSEEANEVPVLDNLAFEPNDEQLALPADVLESEEEYEREATEAVPPCPIQELRSTHLSNSSYSSGNSYDEEPVSASLNTNTVVAEIQDPGAVAAAELGFTQFRSKGQEVLIQHVLRRTSSVAGILPTGAGKTLAIFVAMTEKATGISVVVYPLRSVFDDAVKRLHDYTNERPEYRHKWMTWNNQVPLAEVATRVRLLLVTAEEAKGILFLDQVRQNHTLVRRVIFDEAPVFVNSHYRLGLSSLPGLLRSRLSCPFVLLTGTLQPAHEQRLRDAFYCPGLEIIRAPTVRPEISHVVVRTPRREVSAEDILQQVSFRKDELTIVFVRSLEEVKHISSSLEDTPEARGKVTTYFGALNRERRHEAATLWSSTRKPIMVATTAFAYGIDEPKCSTVIHVEGAYDIDTYLQAAGRGGRSGKKARSVILIGKESGRENNEFNTFVNSKCCRLTYLSSLQDPVCFHWDKSCGHCDWCLRAGLPANDVPEAWRRGSVTKLNPPKKTSPSDERAKASLAVARSKQQLQKLLKMCRAKFCFTCFIMSRGQQRVTHALSKCPRWKNRCFGCGSIGCKRNECRANEEVKKTLTSCNLCVTCSMPPYIMDVNLHSGQFSMGKHCPYRDTVLPIMKLAWHDSTTKAAIEQYGGKCFASNREFYTWSVDSQDGFLGNFLSFVVNYCNT